MKRTALAAASAAALLGLAGIAQTSGAEAGERKNYDHSGFDALEVSGGIDVEFMQAREFLVSVESLDGGFDEIEIKVDDDTLVIRRPGDYSWNSGEQARFRVMVSAPELEDIEVSSAASVSLAALEADDLDIEASSSGSVSIGRLVVDELDIEASSAASISVTGGACEEISVEASSAASVMAGNLICERADIEASSGASVEARGNDAASAEASSGASVTLFGAPKDLDSEESSGGSVDLAG